MFNIKLYEQTQKRKKEEQEEQERRDQQQQPQEPPHRQQQNQTSSSSSSSPETETEILFPLPSDCSLPKDAAEIFYVPLSLSSTCATKKSLLLVEQISTSPPTATTSISISNGPTLAPVNVAHIAALCGNTYYLELLSKSDRGRKLLSEFAHPKRSISEFVCRSKTAETAVKTAKCLNKLKFFPTMPNGDNTTLQYVAVQSQHLELVKYFHEELKLSLDVTIPDENENLFHLAVRKFNLDNIDACIEMIKYILKNSNIDILSKQREADRNYSTAFAVACRWSPLPVVKYLVSINAHLSCLKEATEDQIKFSIKKMSKNSKKKLDVLMPTLSKEHHRRFVKRKGFPVFCLESGGQDDYQKKEEDEDPDEKEDDFDDNNQQEEEKSDEPSSSIGAENNKNDDVEREYLVSLPIRRQLSNSPLHRAAENGCVETIKFLCEIGGFETDLHVKVGKGKTVLFCAGYCTNNEQALQLIKFLIEEKSCDPDIADDDQCSLMYLLAWYNNAEAIRYLLQRRAKSSILFHKSSSPFIGAIGNQNVEAVRAFIEEQGDISSPRCGQSPLEYARSKLASNREDSKRAAIVKLIEASGVF